MKTYIGTKIINAKPMTRQAWCDFRGWALPETEAGMGDDAGYLVEYTDGGKPNHPDYDGYISWSPAPQFEGAYREMQGMTFGMALEALKRDEAIARTGWNGKNLDVKLHRPLAGELINRPFAFISYPGAAGAKAPWVPSQTDMLAEDWVVVACLHFG